MTRRCARLKYGSRAELWVWALALAVALTIAYELTFFMAQRHYFGGDAGAYWAAWHRPHLYGPAHGDRDAYLYSPAFAQAIRPFALLPRPVFCSGWIAVEAVAYAWLLKPLRARWWFVAMLACLPELLWGNLHAAFALVALFGFTSPALWSIPLLTKIVAAQGLLWFAARMEWRKLAVALGTAAVVAAVSYLIAPHLWSQWFSFLRANSAQRGTTPRLVVACVITIVAARTDRRWVLPISLALAEPMFNGLKSLSLLAAIPRIVERKRVDDRSAAMQTR